MINPHSIPSFFGAILVIGLGILVYVKNKSGYPNKIFFLLTISLFIWLLSESILYSIKNEQAAIVISKCVYIGVTAIPLINYFLSLSFLRLKVSKSLTLYFLSLYLIALFFIFKTDFVLSGINKYFWGYYGRASNFHFVYLGLKLNILMVYMKI